MASSSDAQVTGMGSTLTRAEMVISWAAPASSSATSRHGGLGGAADATPGPAVLTSAELAADGLSMVIGGSCGRVRYLPTPPTRLPGTPSKEHRTGRDDCQEAVRWPAGRRRAGITGLSSQSSGWPSRTAAA